MTILQQLSITNYLLSCFQGHLLLIGVSGAGKTTLSRFVAWINGLSVYQIKVCVFRKSVCVCALRTCVGVCVRMWNDDKPSFPNRFNNGDFSCLTISSSLLAYVLLVVMYVYIHRCIGSTRRKILTRTCGPFCVAPAVGGRRLCSSWMSPTCWTPASWRE